MENEFSIEESFAKKLDTEDSLSKYRDHFFVPKGRIYFDGNSSDLCSAPIEGSLKLILEAGIDEIRKKSIKMTSYLIFLVDNVLTDEPYNYTISTPRNPNNRTGLIALEHNNACNITEYLKESCNIITTFHPPNTIRISPSPLYNQYIEIWKTVHYMKKMIDHNRRGPYY